MKFSHELYVNSVTDWRGHYINYEGLKRLVYGKSLDSNTKLIRTLSEGHESGTDTELGTPRACISDPLLGAPNDVGVLRAAFLAAVTKELVRVEDFYVTKQNEVLHNFAKLVKEIEQVEKTHARQAVLDISANDVALDEAERLVFWSAHGNLAMERDRKRLAEELEDLYAQVTNLTNFANLNKKGFRKICKKFDKETGQKDKIQDEFMTEYISRSTLNDTTKLQNELQQLTELYALIRYDNDVARTTTELSKKQKDQFEYERRTIFQEMMETERYTESAILKDQLDPSARKRKRILKGSKLLLFTLLFAILLMVPIFDEPEKQNCLALLVYVSCLWCFEALPLYVTAMVIPFLIVTLRVLKNPDTHERLPSPKAAEAIFHIMYSEVIFLLLGGFVIASALSKHFIAKRLATAVLNRVGNRPSTVLITVMLIATVASTFISNVTAPVLCFGLLQPILRSLNADDPLSKSLILGIALASNLGGMMSPIASPQNIFAVERMSLGGQPPSWLSWFAVSIPVALLGNLICWSMLLAVYKPGKGDRKVRQLPQVHDKITYKQVFVVLVTVLTIGLWCANSMIKGIFGSMGVLACIPLIMFCGFGIVRKEEFDRMSWDIITLAQGGLALGEAVKSSGLLETIAQSIKPLVTGYSVWMVLVIFCGLVLVFTTFISHTVGAMVILPIVQSIGEHMPDGHPNLLVFGSALMCSGAMGLPISGFPNMFASGQQDASGKSYLSGRDFQIVGVPCSILTYICIVTVGYAVMRAVGF